MRGIRPRPSCSTWIPASARPMASRKVPPTTATSAAPATIRCSCSTSSAIWSAATLRPGNVHSADGWRDVLEPVVARYRDRKPPPLLPRRRRLRLTGHLRVSGSRGLQVRDPPAKANPILQQSIAHLLTRPVGRPPNHVRRYYASFSYQAGVWDKKRRVVAKVEWHPGELVSARRLHRHQSDPPGRAGRRLLQPARHGRAVHQGRQERHQVDAAVVPVVRRPTPCGCSFTRWPTTSATSCARWRCRSQSSTGR